MPGLGATAGTEGAASRHPGTPVKKRPEGREGAGQRAPRGPGVGQVAEASTTRASPALEDAPERHRRAASEIGPIARAALRPDAHVRGTQAARVKVAEKTCQWQPSRPPAGPGPAQRRWPVGSRTRGTGRLEHAGILSLIGCGVPRHHTDRLPAQCRCRHRGRDEPDLSQRTTLPPHTPKTGLRGAITPPPGRATHGPLIPGCLAGLPIVGTALIRGVPAGFPKTRHLKSSSRTCMISQIALSGEPSSHAPAELRPPRTGRSERPPPHQSRPTTRSESAGPPRK